jgi:cytoskeletal protein CcmA (bactofilin family)
MKQDTSPQINEICRISKPTVIEGFLDTTSDIRIDGTFKGNIRTKGKIVVGESAIVEGTIVAQNADISGKIKGELYIGDTLSLRNKSITDGTMLLSKLSIDIGAIFNGTCKMVNKEDFEKAASKAFATK